MMGYGDDSAIPVPAIFMFVPGMAVVVNQNTHQGLKVVNGSRYVALDVILDRKYPGYRISRDTTLHFGPPGRGPASLRVNERLALRRHATRNRPSCTHQHKDRVSEQTAMATMRRYSSGITLRSRVRMHRL
ncbi:hypothetical protein MBR_10622, partial [Metarhizium brunneum ARSEF 3297]